MWQNHNVRTQFIPANCQEQIPTFLLPSSSLPSPFPPSLSLWFSYIQHMFSKNVLWIVSFTFNSITRSSNMNKNSYIWMGDVKEIYNTIKKYKRYIYIYNMHIYYMYKCDSFLRSWYPCSWCVLFIPGSLSVSVSALQSNKLTTLTSKRERNWPSNEEVQKLQISLFSQTLLLNIVNILHFFLLRFFVCLSFFFI